MDDNATSTSSAATLPDAAPTASRDKVRLRFSKGGELRFISHHDLLRCFERLVRRAQVPVAHTQGFHPHPRIVLALSLPLGVEGLEEVADLELEPGTLQSLTTDDLQLRLAQHAPPGLEMLSVREIPLKCSPAVRSFCYRLRPLPPDRIVGLREAVRRLLASQEILVPRARHKGGPTPTKEDSDVRRTTIDVRPFVRDLRVVNDALEMELWLTPQGTARPAELLELLELNDCLDQSAVLQRSRLELRDEPTETRKPWKKRT